MSSLKSHIKSNPEKPMRVWAEELGVSRPFLIALIKGKRNPSLNVALRIQARTNGAVSVTEWPNLRAVIEAVEKKSEATR